MPNHRRRRASSTNISSTPVSTTFSAQKCPVLYVLSVCRFYFLSLALFLIFVPPTFYLSLTSSAQHDTALKRQEKKNTFFTIFWLCVYMSSCSMDSCLFNFGVVWFSSLRNINASTHFCFSPHFYIARDFPFQKCCFVISILHLFPGANSQFHWFGGGFSFTSTKNNLNACWCEMRLNCETFRKIHLKLHIKYKQMASSDACNSV